MPVKISIDTTFGFLFHALTLCCILYGAGCLQGWLYFRKYSKRDPWLVQALVYSILIFDTCQIGCLYAAVYTYLVSSIGNPDPGVLGHIVPSLIVELIFSGLIALLVQHFYCYRILQLSKNWFLAGFVSLTSLGSFGTLLYFIIVCLSRYTELSQLALRDDISIATNVLGLFADLSISCIMVYLLHTIKTGFRRSTDMLNRLIIFTFNAGLPTSICAVLTIILLKGAPGTFIYIFVYVSMGRFYTNSLLVTLNSREYIRQSGSHANTSTNDNFVMSVPTNLLSPQSHHVQFKKQDPENGTIAIRVDEASSTYIDKEPQSSLDIEGK
ncbi:hypothetical protein C8J56DRAFT_964426 [Mycena floridula]|nr:hypothetical protein C8J56DRAFT_964426 [Mycena floridula]